MRALATSVLFLLLGVTSAVAAPNTLILSWVGYEEGLRVLEESGDGYGLVVIAATGDDFASRLDAEVLSERAVARLLDDDGVVLIRLDPSSARDAASRYEVAAGGHALVVVDVEGAAVETFAELPGPQELARSLRHAEHVSSEKARVLRGLRRLVETGERALEAGHTREASEAFARVAALRGQLETSLIGRAEEGIERLVAMAEERLAAVDALIGSQRYGEAQRDLVAVRNAFPLEAVLAACQERQQRLAEEQERRR